LLVGTACLLVLVARPVFAYRPFDSTDAAIAELRRCEIEVGPVGYVIGADGRKFVVSTAIVNLGVSSRWEVVLEGKTFAALREGTLERRVSLRDAALSLKGILREGSLQDHAGPSVALEIGTLLPTLGDEHGIGASVTGIVSQRWPVATLHVNGSVLVTRAHDWGGFGGAIVEGPSRWPVRPVAEAIIQREAETTVGGLVGAIWEVKDHLSLDAGWRAASVHGARTRELRVGVTFSFAVGSNPPRITSPTSPLIPGTRRG
jgi:hypothetical protein